MVTPWLVEREAIGGPLGLVPCPTTAAVVLVTPLPTVGLAHSTFPPQTSLTRASRPTHGFTNLAASKVAHAPTLVLCGLVLPLSSCSNRRNFPSGHSRMT